MQQDRLIRRLSEIQPVSATNPQQPDYFYVAGYQKGVPSLIRMSDLQSDNTHPDIDTFYISSSDIRTVSARLNEGLTDRTERLAELKIQRDEPSKQRQRMYLHFISDEFEYFSVYDVEGPRAIPVAYGNITRSNVFISFAAGFRLFLVIIALGVITAIVVAIAFTRGTPSRTTR